MLACRRSTPHRRLWGSSPHGKLRSAAGALLLATSLSGAAAPLRAQDVSADSTVLYAQLLIQIEEMRTSYEERLKALEEEVSALRTQLAAPEFETPPTASPTDELAALRAAAEEAAGTTTLPQAAPLPRAEGPAPAQSLNRFNPEISFTGDFLAVGSSEQREEFRAREFELDFQANLDPFSRTRWTLAFTDEGEAEIEEGYITYPTLPGGLGLTAGRFRQQFGSLNRQHAHALPQSDYPLVLRTYFGEEALAQTGLSARWLLPRPWADANEVTVELTDGENEAFGGEDFEDFSGLVHLKNFWDVSDAAYFEVGLSGILGKTSDGHGRQLFGTDLTYHWQPPQRAKYRELTWRTEILLSQLDRPEGGVESAWGGYTYLEGQLAQNLSAGARFDWVEDPFDAQHRRWGVVPYLTWWQSEFVRLRAEYRRFEDDLVDDTEDSFLLQLTWAAGPHKHETY
ncbi:MAG: hypothetical protein KDD47_14980 [Acidobacteria bacterium]|nr:hypothetical protein [Acidobacteriota bacterium]